MYVRTSDGLGRANRSSAEDVRWVLRSLNSILGLNLKVDGIMGPQTRSAIRSLQQRQGLVADGVVGPKTEAALVKGTGGAVPGQVTTLPPDTKKPADARLIRFDKNSAKLKDFHAPDIDKVADRVVENWKTGQPIFTIYLKGHTSSEAPPQYDIGLGNHRALAVRKALQKALEHKQKNLSYKVLILAQSKGAKGPIDTNETEEGRSQNRRAEIFLSTKALMPLLQKKKPEVKAGPIRPETIPWVTDFPRAKIPSVEEGLPPCKKGEWSRRIDECIKKTRNWGLTADNPYGIVLLQPSPGIKTLTVGFVSP